MTIKGKRDKRNWEVGHKHKKNPKVKTSVIHTQATTKYKNVVVGDDGVHKWTNRSVTTHGKGTRRGNRR